jgi:hypothetical protein
VNVNVLEKHIFFHLKGLRRIEYVLRNFDSHGVTTQNNNDDAETTLLLENCLCQHADFFFRKSICREIKQFISITRFPPVVWFWRQLNERYFYSVRTPNSVCIRRILIRFI